MSKIKHFLLFVIFGMFILGYNAIHAQNNIRWNDNSNNEDGFNIYRSKDGVNFDKIDQVPPNTFRYIDNNVEVLTPYFYKVSSFIGNIESDYSNTIQTKSEGKILNVSTRALVGRNNNIVIAGFVLDKKTKVLIRGVGPTLSKYGISNYVNDPKIELYNEVLASIIDSNDNWNNNKLIIEASDSVGAFQLNSSSKDSAILITLDKGLYTVRLSSNTRAEGIGLIEIYEVR